MGKAIDGRFVMRAGGALVASLAILLAVTGCSRTSPSSQHRLILDTHQRLFAETREDVQEVTSVVTDVDPVEAPSQVVIYGAEWCGPCHQAAAFLARRGVPFVQRNVDTDADAATEMKTRLDRAGLRGGSIPVLDVRGRILVGFNPRAVERALTL